MRNFDRLPANVRLESLTYVTMKPKRLSFEPLEERRLLAITIAASVVAVGWLYTHENAIGDVVGQAFQPDTYGFALEVTPR